VSGRRPSAAPALLRDRWDVLLVIAAGGALGSLARWAVGETFPHGDAQVAWGTWLANVSGSFLLGVLMVFVLDVWPPRRYLRPFLGVGVLGGYTTFSTYMLDTRGLLAGGEPAAAFGYLFGTLLTGLLAVWLGVVVARAGVAAAVRRRTRAAAVRAVARPEADDQKAPDPDQPSARSPR
jgi:CrcB protein